MKEVSHIAAGLEKLFQEQGDAVRTGRVDAIPLIDPSLVLYIASGHLDISATSVTSDGGAPVVQKTHLLRIGEGELFFGFHGPPGGRQVILLGQGSNAAEIYRLPIESLRVAAQDPTTAEEIGPAVDRWVSSLCELCTVDMAPTGAVNLRPDTVVTLNGPMHAQPQSGVLWVRPREGSAHFLNQKNASAITGEVLFPISSDAWITSGNDTSVLEVQRSSYAHMNDAYWRGLDLFHTMAEQVIDVQRKRHRERDQHRLIKKTEVSRSTLDAALGELESILHVAPHRRGRRAADSSLLAACRLVGERAGIDIHDPAQRESRTEYSDPMEEIARVSRAAIRRVELDDGWHTADNGPLLGFIKEGRAPVALLPTSHRSYELHNPADHTVSRVNRAVSGTLESAAYMLYRTLPTRPISGGDLLRFGARGIRRDVLRLIMIGALGGILTLATPVATGHIFDTVIPGIAKNQLIHVTLGLITIAFATGAFYITRNYALIRIQYRSSDHLQAAVWERLLNLKARFFTQYSVGDLGLRAMGINTIMSRLSTSVATTIVTSVFSTFSVLLLFYYSPAVAIVALGLMVVLLAVVVVCGIITVRYQRQIESSHGKIQAMLLQLVNGVAKIRVAAAEDRAYAQWAAMFARHMRLSLGARMVGKNLDVFLAAFPVVTSITIFFLVAAGFGESDQRMSTGSFLAFLAAFTSLLTAMSRLGATAVDVMNAVPVYARLRPILEETPEVDLDKLDPGPLRGRIEVTNISFRYDDDGPTILRNVSLHAEPGEFVALVGPSGSGKSTLLRILLGFEQPTSGSVAYDGMDASGLDPRALRRQLGVVLQDGDLLPGDIYSNIVGSAANLTVNDAWEAATMAGLDRDIEAMPMGLHTIVAEGAGTLSGGQRQRLMIARALVTRPRIVFFDEATSALDNPTQAIVTDSLNRIRATRIVIAHRLSTIISADRIYVLDQGAVVQSGKYDELFDQPGMFHELVKRQIA